MTTPAPPQTSKPSSRWRWRWVVLLVLLAGIGMLGWHLYTRHRAARELREAGFVMKSEAWLGARVWAAARIDWRLVFYSGTWESRPSCWTLEGDKAEELRNLDAVARALRRVNPGTLLVIGLPRLENVAGLKGLAGLQKLDFSYCTALQNVDGLKGLAGLQRLELYKCAALQNVDALKGLTGLQTLDLSDCTALQNVDGLKGLTGLQWLNLDLCTALQNVDGLKGLSGLQLLSLISCDALQNVDGLKGLTGLQTLNLHSCVALQNVDSLKGLVGLQRLFLNDSSKIPASALRELRAALPNTDITFPNGSKLPPQ